jgi:hypothetical protein
MARYSASWSAVTAGTTADSGAAANAAYPGTLRSGNASLVSRINEISLGGLDSASNPTEFIFSRASTLSVGALSVGNLVLMDVNSTAPTAVPSWGNTAATSGPVRTAATYLLEMPLNTYGGIYRWQARVGEEIATYGSAATAGEIFISAKSGTGKTSGHMIFEVV